jgi:hypothetical protein
MKSENTCGASSTSDTSALSELHYDPITALRDKAKKERSSKSDIPGGEK